MSLASLKKSFEPPLPPFPRKRESSAFAFRRTSIYVGAIVFLSLLSCSLPKANPLLEGPKLKGFEQAGPLTIYNRTNLFDYMNGEAEAYLPFGFRLLYVSIFSNEKTDSRMVLEIYDMSTPQGAGGILKEYSSEGSSGLPGIGDAAWADKGIVLLRQRNYFVRIFPDPSPENEIRPTMLEMIDLAREIAAAM